MEVFGMIQASTMLSFELLALLLLVKMLLSCWIQPVRARKKLQKNGFSGPTPRFPLGNMAEMKKMKHNRSEDSPPFNSSDQTISHDILSTALPHFAHWRRSYGKVYVYWLGTEPFLYVADPEFLKIISSKVLAKSWGKPSVFKEDRKPMFGRGLVMVEGEDWMRHRRIISPAFSPSSLRGMISAMVDTATAMADRWAARISTGDKEIDMVKEMISTAGEIIAKTSFGITSEMGPKVLHKLGAMQVALFQSHRYVGLPFGKLLCPAETLEANKLGKEIDSLLLSIIRERKANPKNELEHNSLLKMLMETEGRNDHGSSLTLGELVDECKTFFFGGHETTAIALMWTLMLLGIHTEWQETLREEIREVLGDREIAYGDISGLKKMGWVMSEVLRLYPPAPNAQRQVRSDIAVGKQVIPAGTNIWIDLVAMHHDEELWGQDAHQFRPERFENGGPHGNCSHKMGFMPFGFGGRMCIGRNLTMMEYKVVLTVILRRFSLAVSPNYRHSPSYLLSLRPGQGLPLLVRPLEEDN